MMKETKDILIEKLLENIQKHLWNKDNKIILTVDSTLLKMYNLRVFIEGFKCSGLTKDFDIEINKLCVKAARYKTIITNLYEKTI